ncbi:MAG: hypothetical protein WCR52_04830 [Bacteroidota bacterium]
MFLLFIAHCMLGHSKRIALKTRSPGSLKSAESLCPISSSN